MREDEAADHAERVQHATATRDFQKHQASLKQRKKEKERLALLQEAAMLEDMQDGADAEFRTYAQGCIDSYAQQGRPVMPMQLQLAKRPPFDSA